MEHTASPTWRGRYYALALTALIIFLIFMATPVVNVLPYTVGRPLAVLKMQFLAWMSDTLHEQGNDLRPTLLAVDPADRERYAALLQGDQTGIMRLVDLSAPGSLSITADMYDFLADSHSGRKRHVRLTGGMFETGFAGGESGLFVLLGDEPLESITPAHPAVQTLVDLAPAGLPVRERETALWQARGQTINSLTLTDEISAQINQTVLLRSVIDETDTIIALRPIRKDSDGSMTILWKIVKQL